MDDNPGTAHLENQTSSLPPKNSKRGLLFFLLFGIIVALMFFPEGTRNFLKKVDLPGSITSTPQPTPIVLSTKSYLITNETEGISVNVQDEINLELKLNKNALNKLEISNLNVLKEEEALNFNLTKGVYVGTIKALQAGESVITVNEQGPCSFNSCQSNQILKFKVTVTEKSSF